MTTVPRAKLWVASQRLYVEVAFDPDLKWKLRNVPGGRWDPEIKAWHYPASPDSAKTVYQVLVGRQLAVDPQAAKLLHQAAEQDRAQQHRVATDLPDIPGRTSAWLHQRRAYHFAAPRSAAMLAMDMGTGKTRAAIGLMEGAWRNGGTIVLCPRSVLNVWPNQLAIHAEQPWNPILPPGNSTVAKRAEFIQRHVTASANARRPWLALVNYEACWRKEMANCLMELAINGITLVLDESHRLKAPGGRQSMFVAKLAGVVRASGGRVLCLTGTPMPHGPQDVYAQFRAMDPGIFGTSFNRFRSRYCVMGGWEGKQILSYTNETELAQKFGSATFVVKKSEAGLDLPETLHIPDVAHGEVIGRGTFELGEAEARAYDAIDRDFILGVQDGTVTAANALVKLLRLSQVTSGFVRDDEGIDHTLGDSKIDALDEILQDIPPREPVVVFARFKKDLQAIRDLAARQERRYGEVSGDTKPSHPDYGLNSSAQMRDDLDLIALQIQSGGVGIDLSRACYAVYFSLDYSLGNYSQSLARLDRPGQTRPVTYYHLIARGTGDETIYRALQARENVVEAMIARAREHQPVMA